MWWMEPQVSSLEPQVSSPEHRPLLWSAAVLSPSPPVMRMQRPGPYWVWGLLRAKLAKGGSVLPPTARFMPLHTLGITEHLGPPRAGL